MGREPPIIAAGLADVLVGSLHLDFAFVRLCDPKGGAAIEVTRGDAWKAFSERLRTHLGGVDRFSCKEIIADLGGAEPCCGIVIPIGVNAEAGLVAAACTRTDFPSEIDQLLLSVAANHAAAAFQNAHLRHELDAKVAELREARDENEPTMEFILQRTHPEDRALVRQVSNRAQQEREHFHFEHRLLMPNGSIKHIEVVAHAVARHASDKFGVVGAVLDVTERKRAEALRDGESRILEMIARDAPLEEILENLVRVVEAQFAGLLCSVLLLDEDGQHVRHGAAPSLPKAYTKAIDGLCIGPKAGSCGTAMYRRETVIVTDILQDPLWEPYRALAEPLGFRACWSTPILAHSGKALGSFAMYYREPRGPSSAETRALEMATHLAGIATERKLAREERERLRQAQADLAHINRVTTMGELTASLAHEIRQPISAAVTNAKTCLRWLGRDKPDVVEAAEAASRLVKDVTRAADIIGRISSLFKKDALQRELVDVNELIREMIVLLRSEANRYSISIRTELAEDVPKVMADRVQLQQVFMNLMLNGIDAMKETSGGSELAIKSEADDGQLLISVSDTGVGLPPEQADQIFRAFFTTKENGTGMGLPISRSIIESHGGRLWFTGNSGRGATFQFTLPTTVAAHA